MALREAPDHPLVLCRNSLREIEQEEFMYLYQMADHILKKEHDWEHLLRDIVSQTLELISRKDLSTRVPLTYDDGSEEDDQLNMPKNMTRESAIISIWGRFCTTAAPQSWECLVACSANYMSLACEVYNCFPQLRYRIISDGFLRAVDEEENEVRAHPFVAYKKQKQNAKRECIKKEYHVLKKMLEDDSDFAAAHKIVKACYAARRMSFTEEHTAALVSREKELVETLRSVSEFAEWNETLKKVLEKYVVMREGDMEFMDS